MQADYVIIGAGSAGCVLANRLTEDPTARVILIEAGGRDWNPLIHIPVGYMKLLDHTLLTWGFKAEADPGTNGRAIAYPRGPRARRKDSSGANLAFVDHQSIGSTSIGRWVLGAIAFWFIGFETKGRTFEEMDNTVGRRAAVSP